MKLILALLLVFITGICVSAQNSSPQTISPTNSQQSNAGEPSTESGGESSSEVFRAKEVTKKAVITKRVKAKYTKEARANDVEGAVRLRVVLRATGQVDIITVVDSLPHGLTESAIEAVKKLKFKPAMKNGKPVSQYATLVYDFKLR